MTGVQSCQPDIESSYGEHIVVTSKDAEDLAGRFETEQYAVGMAFSYAQTVAASRALRAYAKLLSTPICTEDDGTRDPVYLAQLSEAEAMRRFHKPGCQYDLGECRCAISLERQKTHD